MSELLGFIDRHFWAVWWLVFVAILLAPMKAGAIHKYIGR